VCYRRQTFQEHLVKAHQMVLDSDPIKAKLDNCRIGRNCQSRFWCGFCNSLVELKKRGVDAWTERFDHIDDHFMGRHKLPKQSIQDWVPMDSDRPKGEVESPHSLVSQTRTGLGLLNRPRDLQPKTLPSPRLPRADRQVLHPTMRRAMQVQVPKDAGPAVAMTDFQPRSA